MGLLAEDTIVMRQVRTFIDDEYTIHSADGREVGRVHTEGGLGRRFFLGNRTLTATELDGSLVVSCDDPVSFGRDKFTLSGPDGEFASITKKIRLIFRNLAVNLADGRELTLKGSALEFSFDVTDAESGTVYAQVTRSLGDLPTFLLSKETFLVSFAPGADETVRSATIGALLAIDMIRKKERRAVASS